MTEGRPNDAASGSGLAHHPDSGRFERALARCRALVASFRATIYRATGVDYANGRDLLSGEGARLHGARWTPRGSFPAVYGGLDPQVAPREAMGTGGKYGLGVDQRLPLVMVAVDANIQSLLDLTAPEARIRLRFSIERMVGEDWEAEQAQAREARAQAIARLARASGIQGLLVPSARFKGEKNIVVFPDRVLPGGLLIQNRDKLPAPRS